MAKEQPTVTLGEFSTAIRDRLLNLISWAKSVPGIKKLKINQRINGWYLNIYTETFVEYRPSVAKVSKV